MGLAGGRIVAPPLRNELRAVVMRAHVHNVGDKKSAKKTAYRRERRSAITEIARIITGDESFSCVVLDISVSGAKLWTRLSPAIGALVTLEISNFGSVAGAVVRRDADGLGLEFRVAPHQRRTFKKRLEAILANLEDA